MAFLLIQSTASQVVMLKAYLASDHVSAATGKTIPVTISKNGGAFGNPNAGATNLTEVSNGWYKVTLDATDTATAGPLVIRGTEAATDDVELICLVQAAVSAAPSAATIADAVWDEATAGHVAAGSAGKLIIDTAAYIDTEVAAIVGYIDTEVAAIKAKTDQLTFTSANKVDSTIQAAGDFAQGAADKVWSTAARTLTSLGTTLVDEIFTRDLSAITGEAARSLLNAVRFLRNKWTVVSGTLTVYEEDDTTTAWTSVLSATAGADPVTGSDPA